MKLLMQVLNSVELFWYKAALSEWWTEFRFMQWWAFKITEAGKSELSKSNEVFFLCMHFEIQELFL